MGGWVRALERGSRGVCGGWRRRGGHSPRIDLLPARPSTRTRASTSPHPASAHMHSSIDLPTCSATLPQLPSPYSSTPSSSSSSSSACSNDERGGGRGGGWMGGQAWQVHDQRACVLCVCALAPSQPLTVPHASCEPPPTTPPPHPTHPTPPHPSSPASLGGRVGRPATLLACRGGQSGGQPRSSLRQRCCT